MDDMTIYTPINGATQTQFTIPLFNVDPSYAGQTINVDLFDIGDVGGGAAYVAIQAPGQAAGSFATVASGSTMTDLGDSQTSGGTNTVSEGWSTGQPSTCACFQTAASGGGAAIYNLYGKLTISGSAFSDPYNYGHDYIEGMFYSGNGGFYTDGGGNTFQ